MLITDATRISSWRREPRCLEAEIAGSPAGPTARLPALSLRRLVNAAQAQVGVLALAAFPQCSTSVVMVEVWLGHAVAEAGTIRDGVRLLRVDLPSRSQRLVLLVESMGLLVAAVLISMPNEGCAAPH